MEACSTPATASESPVVIGVLTLTQPSQDLGTPSALGEAADLSPRTPASPKQFDPDAGDESEPGWLMKFLLCAVAALEGADDLLMPATMLALQEKAGIKFTDLIYLGGVQAVCTNLAGPFWGMLADRGSLSRRNILIIGALGQGVATVSLAITTRLTPMVFLRGLNGIMLASLRPISNGVVADTTAEAKRGKVFGQVQSSLVLGMLFTSVVATPIARMDILGIQGWRVAFGIVGVLSLVVCVLLKLFFVEPARTGLTAEAHVAASGDGKAQCRRCYAVAEEIGSLCQFFKIPTFVIMIVQGIFGSIPWAVLGYMTLFFQLSGLTDGEATVLQTEQLVVGIFGNILGGYVADVLARRLGYHGRPLVAQFTVAVGLPLIFMMFWGIPPGKGTVGVYAALLFAWALLACWAQSGTNYPILCEIVPAEARCRILAWEGCLEHSIANAVAPPIVAIVASRFGYALNGGGAENEEEKLASAVALGRAMTIIVVGPGLVCLCAYSLLHWSYPRDARRLRDKAAASSLA